MDTPIIKNLTIKEVDSTLADNFYELSFRADTFLQLLIFIFTFSGPSVFFIPRQQKLMPGFRSLIFIVCLLKDSNKAAHLRSFYSWAMYLPIIPHALTLTHRT
ncbi:hypothetical protein [Carboxylicivirga sp. N1Y90]|uniref:hypothetical protein n=1 Tax=Carboxylicivirga fragile TaxID=3417571 RepID=UPI003D332D06|nr:hypothetical protein [Marinilabiliaceae bacterium N1Y90]